MSDMCKQRCEAFMSKFPFCSKSVGILILRIGIGAMFIFAGYMKVSDMAGTVYNFSQMGIGSFWAYLVGYVELLGGIVVLLGSCGTRLAGGLFSIIMIVAVVLLKNDMVMAMTPAAFLISTLALTFTGAGKYSLNARMCKKCECKSANCKTCSVQK